MAHIFFPKKLKRELRKQLYRKCASFCPNCADVFIGEVKKSPNPSHYVLNKGKYEYFRSSEERRMQLIELRRKPKSVSPPLFIEEQLTEFRIDKLWKAIFSI